MDHEDEPAEENAPVAADLEGGVRASSFTILVTELERGDVGTDLTPEEDDLAALARSLGAGAAIASDGSRYPVGGQPPPKPPPFSPCVFR